MIFLRNKNLFTQEKRIFGLDILRFLAIAFVLLLHADRFVPKIVLPFYHWLCLDGVAIFFVLSGFLIGGIFINQIEKNGISLKEIKKFWLKRWTRTLPNYYLFLFFVYTTHLLLKNGDSVRIFDYIFFLQNIYESPPLFFFWAWSLSVEEWFYILLPLSIFILRFLSSNYKLLLFIYITLIIISITFFRLYSIDRIVNFRDLRASVLFRLDAIMYGVLAAYIKYYFPKIWIGKRKLLLVTFCIFIALDFFVVNFVSSYLFKIIEFSLISIAIFSILPFLDSIKSSPGPFSVIVTIISIISYSLYLINPIVSGLINHLANFLITNTNLPLSFLFPAMYTLFWAVSLALAYFIYVYFEKPATDYLRNKLIKR